MNIQWYPGHMTRTRRQMAVSLKQVDAVCEVVDARHPTGQPQSGYGRNRGQQAAHSDFKPHGSGGSGSDQTVGCLLSQQGLCCFDNPMPRAARASQSSLQQFVRCWQIKSKSGKKRVRPAVPSKSWLSASRMSASLRLLTRCLAESRQKLRISQVLRADSSGSA